MKVCVTDGNNRIALAAVRALGEAGHDVVSVEQRSFAARKPVCFFSRYTTRASVHPDIRDESALPALIRSAGNCDVILPVSINMLYFCAINRTEFKKAGIAVAAPTPAMLDSVNEKPEFLELAASAGVETPKTFAPVDVDELERTAGETSFPAVVKLSSDRGLYLPPGERYRIVQERSGLENAWEHFRKLNPRPLVQEFVEGTGYGYFFLADGAGGILREMCHRRIREYPVGGGPSTMCVSIRDRTLLELGRKIVVASGFRGAGMVEFKRCTDGGFVALEINPRLWGSLPLGMAAGVNFPDAWVRLAAGKDVGRDLNYRTGVRVRFIAHDVLAGISHLRRKRFGEAFSVFTDFFRSGIREGVLTFRDPTPGIAYLLGRLSRKAGGGK